MDESLESAPPPTPHQRRPRYSGRNPRRFEEKYKEHNPERYAGTIAKVLAAGKTPAGAHRPIMVAEILEVLAPKPGEVAVDCTLGYGGHAQEILARLQPGGKLLGLDADPIELPKTGARLRVLGFGPDTFTIHRTNFAGLEKVLAENCSPSPERLSLRGNQRKEFAAGQGHSGAEGAGATESLGRGEGEPELNLKCADIVLADLGVSSMQLDDPSRGFSIKHEGPLDMRMNPQRGWPASALLVKIRPDALATLLVANADEPQAAMLGPALAGKAFATTTALAKAIRAALPRVQKEERELTIRRVFQALRIAVNDEFSALETFLRNLPACLNPGGRVAILTFHSGEDRRVKQAFARGRREGLYDEISEEVIRATAEERHSNPRSAPAKLRWARKGSATSTG